MNAIIAFVIITLLVSSLSYWYRFAMKDAMNMYPRSRKPDDDNDNKKVMKEKLDVVLDHLGPET